MSAPFVLGAPFVVAAVVVLATASLVSMLAGDGLRARLAASIGAGVALALALASAFRDRAHDSVAPFALDGLSAPLVPFVAAVVLATVVGTPSRFADPRTIARQLATGALVLGLLSARDPTVVALFWVLSSVPTALELRARPGGRVFVVHRVVSTVLVAGGVLLAAGDLARVAGSLVVLGVMVREGVFPFHAWVPRLYERAPMGTALTFMQPQIGAYVLARFLVAGPLGTAPLLLDLLGAITMLYGAALALGQRSARRALGYLTVSQSALVLVGLTDGGLIGASGAVLVIVSVGLAQTGLGLALWAAEARRGELRLDVDGGGHASTPALAGATLVLGIASVGIPGTLAFVAEDLVFHATLEARPWVGVAMVLAVALNGISVLRIAFRLFGGRTRATGEGDLTARERLVLGALGVVLVVLGVLPQPLLTAARTGLDALHVHTVAAPSSERR